MPKYASLAEKHRAHREAFKLALEMGITPRSAEILLRERARKRLRACGTLLRQAQDERSEGDTMNFEPMDREPTDFRDWPARWMMRD